MKSKFIYPTKNNMIIAFLIAQTLPITLQISVGHVFNLLAWAQLELVIVACLSLWQLKPLEKMDEREKSITYKWKSRMLDYTSTTILIPIVCLSINPAMEGWDVFSLTALPMFICYVSLNLLYKKEFGYFFVDIK